MEPLRPNEALEQQFHSAMLDLHRMIRAEVQYNPRLLLTMIAEGGGLDAARRLLHAHHISETFVRLERAGRLDLAVEAVVLQPEWQELFTVAERETATGRLERAGFQMPPGQP